MGTRDVPVALVVAAWPDPAAAGEALREARGTATAQAPLVVDAATLVVDRAGKLRITGSGTTDPGEGVVVGGVLGAGLGLVTGGLGWLLWGGGTIGALAARARDGGWSGDRLRTFGTRLTPGCSVLVVVAEQQFALDLERELDATGADVVREAVAGDLAACLDAGPGVVYRSAQVEGDVVATRPGSGRSVA